MSNVIALPGRLMPAATVARASIYAVANRIVAFGAFHAGPDVPPMTQRRIQVLAYLAYGHHLVVHLGPLTESPPEAWQTGPAFGSLAYALHTYGTGPAEQEIAGPRGVERLDAGPARQLVDRVCLSYGHHDEADLATLIKGRGAAWAETLAQGREGATIPDARLRAEFAGRPLSDWD